ncbi:hypothetical protein [Propioniciclava soli]|uniref:hypothetical protein n=1 Tax=Propioniciclava soli TaxID=2775081 RepID=UPI001E612993|nr:hypothetical protein [Propioniciclava soli]
MMPLPWDVLGLLGSAVGNVVTDSWITLMVGIWSASLWLLGVVLGFMDAMLLPDLRLAGPARDVYMTTIALAVVLAGVLSVVQTGVALVRRDGRSVGRLLIGVATFWFYLTIGITYMVAVLAAASAITRALMGSLLGVTSWREFQPWTPFALQDVTDGALATVLGICAAFVIIAAIAFFLIMVARGVALLVMAVTSPIAAAGLVSDLGHTWLWKLSRWFHAAAFSPTVVVLVLGIGIQMANGVAAGFSDGVAASIGSAFASTILIATSAFAPLALFRLLAFMDPGTASGASARAGWAAVGGLQGIIAGKQTTQAGTTSAAASSPNSTGGSQGETQAQANTQGRLSSALNSLGGGTAAPGQPGSATHGGTPQQGGGHQPGALATGINAMRDAYGKGLDTFAGAGAQFASIGADLQGQSGVGHNSYYPDFNGSPRAPQQGQVATQHNATQQQQPAQQPPNQPPMPPVPALSFGAPPDPGSTSPGNSNQTGNPA